MVREYDKIRSTKISMSETEIPKLRKESSLVVLSGKEIGKEIRLTQEKSILGRHGLDIQIDDEKASRQHVKIITTDFENYELIDLNSTNHTYLNNKKVTESKLANGDKIRIGDTILKFVQKDEIDVEYIRQLNFNTIKALALAVDAKDPYTRGHAERVTHYADIIAVEMALDNTRAGAIKYAALLHDIGKIGVSEHILEKKKKLSEEEWEAIKNHVEIGESIIEPIDFLQTSSMIVRHHHEHFDGSGYPDGLKGDSIPLEARILGVADAFDALTTDRPYRKHKTIAEALVEISSNSGRQFDPEVVKAFKSALKKETENTPRAE